MQSEIHKFFLQYDSIFHDVTQHDKLICSKVVVNSLVSRNVIGYKYYFKNEEDMILFKLKYNI